MTASDLQSLFVTTLVRDAGGDRRRWRMIVGDIRLYSVTTHPHCNWSVTPAGASSAIDRVERLADDLRAAHPIVTAG
jgi:hypothetical protein